MYDYADAAHLIIGGGALGALANGALALVNTANQRRIVRQQRMISDRQQQLEAQRLELDQRGQIWSEMRDLIGAQGRQLQASRFELAQLTGKYEELMRRHQALESDCLQRHKESIARIEALELERNRARAESAQLRAELYAKSAGALA